MSVDPLAALLDLPGVRSAADEARTAIDGLLGHRVLRRRSAEVTAESSLRGARAAVQLEDVPVELERLRGLLMAGDELSLPGRPEREAIVLQGAVRCYAELGTLLPTWERAPAQALARLHMLAARDLVPPDELGRPRVAGAVAEDPLELGPAPDPLEVHARLTGLAGLLVSTSAAPAVVAAAIVHGELLALRPFGTVNGIVARAAARLTLIARGLDPKSVSVPEVGHTEQGHSAYGAAARAYVGGGPAGVAEWVRHCCTAVTLGAREGLAVCEAIRRAD